MSSELFGEIYEAIRAERVKKGVCEKDILNMVQDKYGGCLSVANKMNEFKYPVKEIIQAVDEIQAKKGPSMTPVSDFVRIYKKNLEDPQKDKFVLKTIQTLKKLAEDGILTKSGKRYMYESKCEDDDDEDDDDDEEDDGDDGEDDRCDDKKDEGNENSEDNNEDEDDNGPCCDPGGAESHDDGAQDEESPDDDDDDDEECGNEDDDDDDEACNKDSPEPREVGLTQKGKEKKESLKEKNYFHCKSMEKMTGHSGECIEKRSEKGATSNMVDSNTEKVVREGEALAFCVRDFIDSLYQARSGSKLEEEITQMDDDMIENMDADDVVIEKKLKNTKRKFSSARNKSSRAKYRSRSPMKKNNANLFNTLKQEGSETLCYRISSQSSHEPMDTDIENLENDKDIEIEYESFHRRSSKGDLPSGPRGDTERRKSVINVAEQKKNNPSFPENEKIFTAKEVSPAMITAFEVDEINTNAFLDTEENDECKTKDMYFDDDITINDDDDDKTSLCSKCHKTV